MSAFTLFVKNTAYIPVVIKTPDDDDPTQMQLYDDTLATALGTPSGFFSNADDSEATSPHADFNAANLIYTGVPGLWFRKILASKLTLTRHTSYFSDNKIFLVVEIPSAQRQVCEGTFLTKRPMT